MATGAPDGVLMIQVAVTVENVPVVPSPAKEYPISTFASVGISSSSYQTIKEVEVTSGRVGVLNAVEMACDDYDLAYFKLVVAGVTIFEDIQLPESFTKEFPELHLAAGQKITLSGKSDGATTVIFYADYSYKEVG